LNKLGYVYLNLDDCWQLEERGKDGHIQVDISKFPDGMKAVGDYIHSKNLKFGIYSDAGVKTCGGRAGSYGYETNDANDYASWGVDYLKYDNCNNQNVPAKGRYITMRNALN
jgi:alpha-galactosidase